jgi:hypothetical protein
MLMTTESSVFSYFSISFNISHHGCGSRLVLSGTVAATVAAIAIAYAIEKLAQRKLYGATSSLLKVADSFLPFCFRTRTGRKRVSGKSVNDGGG